MATAESYLDMTEMRELFEAAGDRNVNAIAALAEALEAAPADFGVWPAEARTAWTKGPVPLCARLERPERITGEVERLIKALLRRGVDTKEARQLYELHFKYSFPRTDAAEDVLNAIGFTDPAQKVPLAARRYRLYTMLRMGDAANCFDTEHGKGAIIKFDTVHRKPAAKGEPKTEECQIQILQERMRAFPLRVFLDTFVLVKRGSFLDGVMHRANGVHCQSEEERAAKLLEGVEAIASVTAENIHRMLVPAVMSEAAYEALAHPAVAKQSEEVRMSGDADSGRWDDSRSVAEMQTRLVNLLAKKQSLSLEEPHVDNIRKLLERDANRTDAAHGQLACQWIEAVAILRQSDLFNDLLQELLGRLDAADGVAVWKDLDFFAELVDKMAKAQIPGWLKVTQEIKGSEYLVDATVKLPQSLWCHTEKLLDATRERGLLEERVFKDFAEGHPTNDHYCWLWKYPTSDPRKAEYLGDVYLLFKTLHLELRGNYLKSQRTLHKLLMDDVKFQQAVMRDGDASAVQNLIRCIRHKPLLDASERQSLLVKIVRIYPQYRSMVEERSTATHTLRPARALTSAASFRRLQAELKELVEVLQPKNTKAIEEARALGDLSENAEYKSAKELQRELGRRRNAMERQIQNIQPTDFKQQQVADVVIPGCKLTLQYEGAAAPETIYLLGVLDGDVTRHFLSYESPLGQLLVSKRAGAGLVAPDGTAVTIVKIEPLPQEILDELA